MFSKRMDHQTLKFQALEHHVHRQLKPCLEGHGFLLLAVSGGLDSMVLLNIVARLKPLITCPMGVVHIHHGPSEDPEQISFRERALKLVRSRAEELGLRFFTNTEHPKKCLSSEAELREFRHREIKKLAPDSSLIVMAHHWDDQLETRLLRLIRGTGSQGFQAMSVLSQGLLRPLLETERCELESYAQDFQLNYLQDPSNKNTNALRNWIREHWLPQLEEKQKGSVKNLALSLDRMADEMQRPKLDLELDEGRIPRKSFEKLSPPEKNQLLVRYLRANGCSDYRRSQLQELVKRLDTSRREHTFHLLKLEWRLNAQHIWTSDN